MSKTQKTYRKAKISCKCKHVKQHCQVPFLFVDDAKVARFS